MAKSPTIEQLEAQALELTKSNVQKGRKTRTGSYLQRFIAAINGRDESTALNRVEIIAKVSVAMCQEDFAADGGLDFSNPEHVEHFEKINKRVKSQVAAAISNSNNNTSLSFNPNTKDKYELHKADSEKGEVYWITEK